VASDGSAAVTEVNWTGLKFSARDSGGRVLGGRNTRWGLAGPWLVSDAADLLLLTVTKSLFRRTGTASFPRGEVLAICGDATSGLVVTDADGAVVLHTSLETKTRRGRTLSLTLDRDRLPLLEGICLVQAWRLLDTNLRMTDPSYSAAQSGSYT
jgi:hypothetical protein